MLDYPYTLPHAWLSLRYTTCLIILMLYYVSIFFILYYIFDYPYAMLHAWIFWIFYSCHCISVDLTIHDYTYTILYDSLSFHCLMYLITVRYLLTWLSLCSVAYFNICCCPWWYVRRSTSQDIKLHIIINIHVVHYFIFIFILINSDIDKLDGRVDGLSIS